MQKQSQPAARASSVTICTRQDLYPVVHGAAVKIVRTAEALSRRGIEVTVVTSDRLQYHRFRDGEHEVLAYPPRFVALTRVPPRLQPWLRRLGVPDYWKALESLLFSLGYPEDEHLLYRPIADVDFWLRTIWVGMRHRTDWFQAEFPGFAAPCWVAARFLRARCSVVQHNVEWKRLEDTTELSAAQIARLRGIELQLCHLSDEVITCSSDDRELMLPDDFERDEITVIPHGVDLGSYGAKTGVGIRQRYGLRRDSRLLFFHGTLHYHPNTVACRILAQEVMPRLRARGLDAQVLICGLSPPVQYSDPDVTYAGCVDDLVTHIASADLCVVPLLDGGGTRLKILEYMAASQPIVSTRKGAEGLLARDGRELRLVEDGDWDGFADAVTGLLQDPVQAAGLGALGRAFVERYSWDAVAGAFVALYEGGASVRGTDFNQHLAVGSDERPLTQVGADVLRERESSLDLTLRKERRGNASTVLQVLQASGGEPQVAHWDDDSVSYELSEAELTRHLPAEPAWQKPRTMILLLNKRCNLKCDFCDLWHFTDMMPFESAVSILQRAPAAGVETLVITGGEPFVHPRIFELIELAKNLGLGVNITTNGTLLRKDLTRLRESRVDSLSISIDGLEERHDKLRGVAGTYQEVMATIEALRASTAIHLNVYFVVTNENVQDLVPVYDMTVQKGIGFDFWPVNGYPHLYFDEGELRTQYEAAVTHIAQTHEGVRGRLDYYRYGLEYMAGKRDHLRCLGLLEQFGVNHEGQLVPCCVWDQKRLQVGSALDEPLDQLFYSERAQQLREQIFNEGCVDQCFNHSLYEFQQATSLSFVVKEAGEPVDPKTALIKESGQAREGEAKDRRRAAAKARRKAELEARS